MFQVSEERVSNIRTVRAFAQEARECDAYDKKITDVLLLTYKEALARGIFWGFVSPTVEIEKKIVIK